MNRKKKLSVKHDPMFDPAHSSTLKKVQHRLHKSFFRQKFPDRCIALSDHLSVHPEAKGLASFVNSSPRSVPDRTRNFSNFCP